MTKEDKAAFIIICKTDFHPPLTQEEITPLISELMKVTGAHDEWLNEVIQRGDLKERWIAARKIAWEKYKYNRKWWQFWK